MCKIGASNPVSNFAVTIINFKSESLLLNSSTVFCCLALSIPHFFLNSKSSLAEVVITTALDSDLKYLSSSSLYSVHASLSGVTIIALSSCG